MLKYLADTVARLKGLMLGITKNPEKWTNQAITPALIQTKINELDVISKDDTDIRNQLNTNQAKAHTAQTAAEKYADSVESIAIGLENGDQDNLNAYGIKLRKAPSKKSAPLTALHPALEDDTDGEGFIVSVTYDPDADMYEWQKGASQDPAKVDAIPEMKFFKATKKTTFVDDEVPKGVRVFYRVRAVNTAGNGAWSEAVSRVQ